jgi:hypothetical protein
MRSSRPRDSAASSAAAGTWPIVAVRVGTASQACDDLNRRKRLQHYHRAEDCWTWMAGSRPGRSASGGRRRFPRNHGAREDGQRPAAHAVRACRGPGGQAERAVYQATCRLIGADRWRPPGSRRRRVSFPRGLATAAGAVAAFLLTGRTSLAAFLLKILQPSTFIRNGPTGAARQGPRKSGITTREPSELGRVPWIMGRGRVARC